MNSSGRTIGMLMTGAGLAIAVVLSAWVYFGYQEDRLQASGAAFTLAIFGVVLVLPLVLGGLFFMKKGSDEERNLAAVREQRKLLDIVKTRGQVPISDLVLEMNSTAAKVKNDLYDLVGRGLFSGYVDWDKGVLYSVEAKQLTDRATCPNCGGKLELGGKGVIKCPYCGAEIFL